MRTALVCLVAVAAVAAPASAELGLGSLQECARITLAESDADEASADVYISKFLPETGSPKNFDEVGAYALYAVQAVLDHLADPANHQDLGAAAITVQVDIVTPDSDSPPAQGQRVSLWLHVDACVGV